MSKKTRKKSPATGSGRASGAGPQKTTRKTVRTTGQRSSPKTAKAAAKTGAVAKTAAKTAANKTKALAKTPPKAPKKAAPQKTASKQPGSVRAKKSAPETAVKPAAIAATETPPATTPAAAPPASRQAVASEGEPAPAFDLPRDGGERVSLHDHLGRKLVIFFYPRADTPGCTKEAMDFNRLKDDFAAIGTAVLGVSADPLKAQESFRNKYRLSVPLISDETHAMIDAYGAWGEKSMYGRSFQGVLRTTVLIGADGRIARVWRGVKVDGHADEVLAAAASL